MRTTLPVVFAVLIALAGVLAVGAVAVMRAYVPNTLTTQSNNQPNLQGNSSSAITQQPQQGTVTLMQQPPNNQTSVGDETSDSEIDD